MVPSSHGSNYTSASNKIRNHCNCPKLNNSLWWRSKLNIKKWNAILYKTNTYIFALTGLSDFGSLVIIIYIRLYFLPIAYVIFILTQRLVPVVNLFEGWSSKVIIYKAGISRNDIIFSFYHPKVHVLVSGVISSTGLTNWIV
jgi:hypothetical protein